MKVVLCGFNWVGCKALDILLRRGVEIFVYTHNNEYHVPSLINMCKKRHVSFSTETISEGNLPFLPDVICSIYYRNMIKTKVIELCKRKIFNLHPSLLPKYRGCSSLTWAMINGDSDAGFTYHYIDEGCDTGNIILQEKIRIEDWDTQESLYMRTMFLGISRFERALDRVTSGHPGYPQSGDGSYYSRGCPHGGEINPDWDYEAKERFIRAMIFPPYPLARFGGENIYSIDDLFSERPE